MKNHCVLLIAICLHAPLVASAGEAEVRATALGLPAKLSKLWDHNKEGMEGSTMQMVEAVHAVAAGLMPSLIVLEADASSNAEKKLKQAEIERDAQGIAAGIYYSRHATGWGGTMTRIESSIAYCEYVETRITHAVTRLFGDDETFEIDQWRKDWSDAGGSLGQDIDAEELDAREQASDELLEVTIEDGELRFKNGASGGIFIARDGVLADRPIQFGARAGQRLVLGCSGLSFRLEKTVDSGSAEPVTSWIRACDLELPESRNGIYHLRFREPSDHSDAKNPPLFLIEIR